MTTQWPLLYIGHFLVFKVAVVERFKCISSVTLLFFFLQSVKGVNRNQWGRYPPHQVLLFGFLYQIYYIVKCFVVLNEVCVPASVFKQVRIFYKTKRKKKV